VYAVERSVEARLRLVAILEGVNAVASIDDIPVGGDAVIVANEVLDNMPAALARRTETGWIEIGIGLEDDELVLVELHAREDVKVWCDNIVGDAPPGTTVSVQLAVSEWIARIFEHFGEVAMCFIDYGARSEELVARDVASVVRTYREHESGIDWLQHPGETDITVDVNVDGVLKAIARAGREARLLSQREFALENGIGELIADAGEGEAFAASTGAIMNQLENRSERLDMEALIDPTGLGAFKVFLVDGA
jgi:SAM-dependent MidA family methyltransferase